MGDPFSFSLLLYQFHQLAEKGFKPIPNNIFHRSFKEQFDQHAYASDEYECDDKSNDQLTHQNYSAYEDMKAK